MTSASRSQKTMRTLRRSHGRSPEHVPPARTHQQFAGDVRARRLLCVHLIRCPSQDMPCASTPASFPFKADGIVAFKGGDCVQAVRPTLRQSLFAGRRFCFLWLARPSPSTTPSRRPPAPESMSRTRGASRVAAWSCWDTTTPWNVSLAPDSRTSSSLISSLSTGVPGCTTFLDFCVDRGTIS